MLSRTTRLISLALGLTWGVALLWVAAQFVTLPVFTLLPTIMVAFFAPGCVALAMMLLRKPRVRGEGADAVRPDVQAVQNTLEQLVLALAIWPGAAVMLGAFGPGAIVTLSVGFVLSRLMFWIGCYTSPALRAVGQALTLVPTLLVVIWALWSFASNLS